ncbi:MAG TPA: hypothetical protein EYN07_02290 [Flavobacteriaceae bacterium]|jgi:hypothetical protein|nr:hypothetical protein [Flavobacteriaceae bacterium]HIN98050.1 hypothetical protein [Flavobacteriaceae bacterium]|tara:strand:+ start:194228 stop:195034 length:807 start_codon:yes stop_codon:yes gene_type:complete
MKKLFLLLIVASAFIACEDIEDNSPALQAEIDNVFFKSLGSAAVVNQDKTLTIQASTTDETLTLFLERDREGVFELGGGNINFAAFEDADGNIFSTEPDGTGIVTVSSFNPGRNISGSFEFQAFLPGVDTLTVQKGIFFEVPFPQGIEIPVGPDPMIPDGTFVAEVNGDLYNVDDVEATVNNTVLVIDGIRGNDTIRLVVSLTATAGSYSIPVGGYYANYIVDGVSEAAEAGNFRIFEHDTTNKTMKGTFTFTTANHEITLGQFNVKY